MSAGSCFAGNLIPYLERAGYNYLRTERLSDWLNIAPEAMNYSTYSAAYGNIYTARQLLQLLRRSLDAFMPQERMWMVADGVIDPYRPGLRYRARTIDEFEVLTAYHLARVREAFCSADVFVFTIGLTEAWVGDDGAVFPACPGTIAGDFDSSRHHFINFNSAEVAEDLNRFINELRNVNPNVQIILTVSPVPLVATATSEHVAIANCYSKSALRVAAEEVCRASQGVSYFPALEMITCPQAADWVFELDRRTVSPRAVEMVMSAFLQIDDPATLGVIAAQADSPFESEQLSKEIAERECEESAAEA